jgi:multiple sugar transport system substrate-binding protein
MADATDTPLDRATTRREFVRRAGAGVIVLYGGAAAKTAAAGVPKYRNKQLAGTLRIMQWSHFVPSYDRWFDNTYIKQWGERNDTEVIVDHVNLAELPARAAAEVSARSGHDLFQFLAPPAAFEDSVLPLNDIVQEVTRKLGRMTPVAYKSSYNPRTRRYFGFPDNYVPDPVHYRRDIWRNVGRAPNSWEDVRQAAARLKEAGNPIGIGMSQELDSNMANMAMMMCYGGFLQNQRARVTLNSRGTRRALAVMRDIYRRGMTPEVFAWTAASNNQAYVAGRLSLALNAISIARTLEGQPWVTTPARTELNQNTWIAPIPRGPFQRMGLEHVMGVYVIWRFARNRAMAKKFLVDAQTNYTPHFQNSGFYNFPGWARGVRGGFRAIRRITARDRARPLGKYTILTTIAQRYTTNVGHPGFANAAVDEVFNKFLIPQMFAQVAQGRITPEEAARTFHSQVGSIFIKWRRAGKI